MNYVGRRCATGYMGAATIMAILVISMMVRCVPVETPEQMQRDLSGLTQAQKNKIVSWQQNKFFPARLP